LPQLFPPAADALTRLVLVALASAPVVVLAAIWAWEHSDYVTGRDVAVEQPTPFSHQHHVGELGIDCRYCHASVEQSRFAGMPSTRVCMSCHSQIWTNAAMLAPVRQSLASGRPLRWGRVNNLPDYVYFDHSVHVAAGAPCASCHGRVHEMPLTRQAAPLTMGWCISCHKDPQPHLVAPAFEYDTRLGEPGEPLANAQNYVRRVETRGLTDCSVCHR
jgi:hypothetical protein